MHCATRTSTRDSLCAVWCSRGCCCFSGSRGNSHCGIRRCNVFIGPSAVTAFRKVVRKTLLPSVEGLSIDTCEKLPVEVAKDHALPRLSGQDPEGLFPSALAESLHFCIVCIIIL